MANVCIVNWNIIRIHILSVFGIFSNCVRGIYLDCTFAIHSHFIIRQLASLLFMCNELYWRFQHSQQLIRKSQNHKIYSQSSHMLPCISCRSLCGRSAAENVGIYFCIPGIFVGVYSFTNIDFDQIESQITEKTKLIMIPN